MADGVFCMNSEALSRAASPEPVAQLLARVVSRESAGRLDRSRRATSAWLMSNGDTERRHTVKVWLRDSPARGVDPVMIVEVDSHSLVSDFNAKRDLYLGRLAQYGQRVSGIEFRFAMRARTSGAAAGVTASFAAATSTVESVMLPEASDADRARAANLCGMVPESLHDVVYAALVSSFRRERYEGDHSKP